MTIPGSPPPMKYPSWYSDNSIGLPGTETNKLQAPPKYQICEPCSRKGNLCCSGLKTYQPGPGPGPSPDAPVKTRTYAPNGPPTDAKCVWAPPSATDYDGVKKLPTPMPENKTGSELRDAAAVREAMEPSSEGWADGQEEKIGSNTPPPNTAWGLCLDDPGSIGSPAFNYSPVCNYNDVCAWSDAKGKPTTLKECPCQGQKCYRVNIPTNDGECQAGQAPCGCPMPPWQPHTPQLETFPPNCQMTTGWSENEGCGVPPFECCTCKNPNLKSPICWVNCNHDRRGTWAPCASPASSYKGEEESTSTSPPYKGYADKQMRLTLSIKTMINVLTNIMKIQKNKLNLGLAYYGRNFQQNFKSDRNNRGARRQWQPNSKGIFQFFDRGTALDFNVIYSHYGKKQFQYYNMQGNDKDWPEATEPFISNEGFTGSYRNLCGPQSDPINEFISFYEETTIKARTEWAKRTGLGGVFCWHILGDYIPGKTSLKTVEIITIVLGALLLLWLLSLVIYKKLHKKKSKHKIKHRVSNKKKIIKI